MRRISERGFTLLELLVVIAIIGLLAGYVAPRYFSQVGRSEVSLAKAQVDAFEKALDQYRLDAGQYPTTEQDFAPCSPTTGSQMARPDMNKGFREDPWGPAPTVPSVLSSTVYDFFSYGNDGAPAAPRSRRHRIVAQTIGRCTLFRPQRKDAV